MKGLITLTVLCLCFASSVSTAKSVTQSNTSEAIQIHVPDQSKNGSFLVRLSLNDEAIKSDATRVELWRSYNGGQYELISSMKKFDALSQNVYRRGNYRYQARLMKLENGKSIYHSSSEIARIKVDLRYPAIQPRVVAWN